MLLLMLREGDVWSRKINSVISMLLSLGNRDFIFLFPICLCLDPGTDFISWLTVSGPAVVKTPKVFLLWEQRSEMEKLR